MLPIHRASPEKCLSIISPLHLLQKPRQDDLHRVPRAEQLPEHILFAAMRTIVLKISFQMLASNEPPVCASPYIALNWAHQ